MRTNVRFRTDKFKQPKGDGEGSPSIELADWLCEKFKDEFNLDYIDQPYYCILFLGDPVYNKLEGACGHVENDVWQVLMLVKPSILDKIFKRPMPTNIQEQFLRSLDLVLQESEEFYSIEWYAEGKKLQEIDHAPTFDV